jgi:hypothetical protein
LVFFEAWQRYIALPLEKDSGRNKVCEFTPLEKDAG